MITIDEKLLKDTINSIKLIGGEHYKTQGNDIYFKIEKDSELSNNTAKLQGVRDYLLSEFGFTLKVYYKKN